LDNIDDCYVDKDESEDTSPVTDHWAKQLEVLTKHAMRRGRFLRSKLRTRKLPENSAARIISYNVYDTNED